MSITKRKMNFCTKELKDLSETLRNMEWITTYLDSKPFCPCCLCRSNANIGNIAVGNHSPHCRLKKYIDTISIILSNRI